MDKGELVPDEITVKMLEKRMEENDVQNGAILDGFPRTVKQAEVLDKILAEKGKKVFEEMIEKAEKLASGIPLVRVDFYHSGNFVKFGEMTLYPDAGMTLYKPDHWDRTLGSWLQLPESKTL